MEIGETLYIHRRADWRRWLKRNYRSADEIWLEYPTVDSGRPRIGYNDAVEEALCFGWIDSIIKSYRPDSRAQRFSPRRPRSGYSQLNKERLARLLAAGKVMPEVADALPDDVDPTRFELPADIVAALKAEPGAWDFFQATSPAYQRIRAAHVDDARVRPEEFDKRLANLVRRCARGQRFGHGIEPYY